MKKKLVLNGEEVEINVLTNRHGQVEFTFNGRDYSIKANQLGPHKTFLTGTLNARVIHTDHDFMVAGKELRVEPPNSSRSKNRTDTGGHMLSPMPGKILQVLVKVGDVVKKGDSLIVMEAMKMEHTIKASEDGVISEVHFGEGQLVAGGVDLVDLNCEQEA
ncbi:hypothetical protein A9Q84_06490 [Halobacteriovorax marinus]|uniref:Lipoyl-binding domain-containing protein n=1 Tax=Halobacteriovorax marinus TaxID=97084 RepID=A0A1Y5FF31_9BACT|nr:hypothetical protein A9Q84_06490 [Halobacteriovorax marinus]